MIGSMSGKVGNVVYYVSNGQQLMRVYVPSPRNPQSKGQTDQRLKMVLAGRLSKIVPPEALEGLASGKSERRRIFNRNVIDMATVTGGQAGISAGDILFSDGSLPLSTGHTVTAQTGSGALNRRLQIRSTLGATDVLPEGYGERYVALLLNSNTSQFDYVVTGLLSVPAEAGQSADTNVLVRVGDPAATYVGFVYVYPFVAVGDGDGWSGRFSYLGTEDGVVIVDTVTGETVARPQLFGQSLLIGTVQLPPPSQSAKVKKDQ